MKRFFLFIALSTGLFAQTNVQKNNTTANELTGSIWAPTGKTIGVRAGGTLDVSAGTLTLPPTIATGAINLDTAAAPVSQLGQVRWNDTDKCVEYVTDGGVVNQVGQEVQLRAKNNSGSTLLNGRAVYITGATGNRPTISIAQANSSVAHKVIGLITTDPSVANNAEGIVTVFGLVRDLDTSAFTEGAELWLSDSVPGAFSATKPTAEASFVIRVGFVARSHATQGSIFVAPYDAGSVTGNSLLESASKSAARTAIDLGNVDNTSDVNKPVSTATQAALDGKVGLSSVNSFSNENTFQGGIKIGQSLSTNPRFIALGDSLTYGVGGTHPYTYYMTLADYAGASVAIDNSGHPSYTISALINTEFTFLTNGLAMKAGLNVTLFWAGTNDIALDGKTANETFSLMEAACRKFRQSGWRVIVATMISRDGYETQKNSLNTLIRANWPRMADGICDFAANSNLGADGACNNPTYFNSDKVHLTDTGYALAGSIAQSSINDVITNLNRFTLDSLVSNLPSTIDNMYVGRWPFSGSFAAIYNSGVSNTTTKYLAIHDSTGTTFINGAGSGLYFRFLNSDVLHTTDGSSVIFDVPASGAFSGTFPAASLTGTTLASGVTTASIGTLTGLTTNGFVKTSGGTGALSVDTATYLTAATVPTATTPLSVYADGTPYSLTSSDAAVDFGTTDPTITFATAGTYLLQGRAYIVYNGATFAANQTATLHLRRTNNTPADIPNATTTGTLRILVSATTDTVGVMPFPPVIYTAAAGDVIAVYGSLSATPAVGSVDCKEASIVATRLY